MKVQRPDATRQIEADLVLLYQAAKLVKERVRALDFIDARQLVDEFARQIRQELDYRLEGRNAQTFHRNFAGDPHVRVPKVYWTYTRARVLTLEWLDGTQLADVDTLGLTLEERRDLAYLDDRDVDDDDLPARLLPRRSAPGEHPRPGGGGDDRPRRLRRGRQAQRRRHDEADAALHRRRRRRTSTMLPKRLADLGVRYPREREDEFLAELREIYYRYYGASLAEIDPIQVIREAFQLIYSMNLRLPTRYLLLDRAIATLGSVGVELYPDFNVFEVAKPYARGLMLERFTPDRVARRARRDAFQYAHILREAPHQIHEILEELRDGQIEVGFVHKGLDDFLADLQRVFNRLVVALIVTGGLIGSSLIGIFAKAGPHLLGVNVISIRRLRTVGRARRMAPLGRCSLRTLVGEKSHFRAEGHLARARVRGYGRRMTALHARRARSVGARLPRAAAHERRLRRPRVRASRRAAALGGAGRARARRSRVARSLPRRELRRHRDRTRRHDRARARARALRRLSDAPVRVRGARRAHPGSAPAALASSGARRSGRTSSSTARRGACSCAGAR